MWLIDAWVYSLGGSKVTILIPSWSERQEERQGVADLVPVQAVERFHDQCGAGGMRPVSTASRKAASGPTFVCLPRKALAEVFEIRELVSRTRLCCWQ